MAAQRSCVIDEIDAALTTWASSALPGKVSVSLAAPGSPPAGKPESWVGLYLQAVTSSDKKHSDPLREWHLVARYLVTAWASKPEDEHKMFGGLLAAALNDASKDVDLSPLPPETWSAFGIPPRPSFALLCPFQVERPVEKAPLVTKPTVIRLESGVSLSGRVLGPGSHPIGGADVRLGGQLVTTDQRGRFRFPLIPRGASQLEVSAKGTRKVFTVAAGNAEPVTLRLPITEG
jgi:hypothetical protein